MKIVSFNVAGFRACLKKGFEDFFKESNADIYCLQEVKAIESEIPFRPEGYNFYLNTADKKGYSGVAVYSKVKPLDVAYGIDVDIHDHEGRVITLEYDNFFLVCVYVPNVKRDLSRLSYRMTWEEDFLKYLQSLDKKKPVIVCGDFNVAHKEIDLANPKGNVGNAGFTVEERDAFTRLLDGGFTDIYRYLYKDRSQAYTWWSYMGRAREKNIGWRIDYFLVSNRFIDSVKDMKIDSDVFGSDHCPIELEVK